MSLTQLLKDQTAAVKLKRTVFGVRKRLTNVDRAKAAEPFHAEADFLSASKKLLDTSEPTYRLVTSTIGRARKYWKSMTVFYPVRGIRLIRKDLLSVFEAQMQVFAAELESNLDELCSKYAQVKQHAREKLGDLFRAGDYPGVGDLRDEFSISWEYPSIEPPNFLKELNPALYEQEQQRVAARFAETMATAEQALATELQGLIGHLCDRLSPGATGKKKTLTPTAVKGLTDFVERFRSIHVTSNSELDAIMSQAESLAKGIDPSALKAQPDQQGQLFNTMSTLKESLDHLIVDQPTRKIVLEDEEDE